MRVTERALKTCDRLSGYYSQKAGSPKVNNIHVFLGLIVYFLFKKKYLFGGGGGGFV